MNETVRKCKFKLRLLQKQGGVVTAEQRKKLVYMGHGDQEEMVNGLVKTDKKGTQRVKTVGEDELRRMNVWMKKAWSTRARRWLKRLPGELKKMDPRLKITKTIVAEWVKDNVSRGGEDPILWGRQERDDELQRCRDVASRKRMKEMRNQRRKRGVSQKKRGFTVWRSRSRPRGRAQKPRRTSLQERN